MEKIWLLTSLGAGFCIRIFLCLFSTAPFVLAQTPPPKSALENATLLLEKRKAPEAIVLIEPALRASPNGPDAPKLLLLLGNAFLATGQKDKGRESLQSVPYRFPKSEEAPKAIVLLRRLFLSEKNLKAAEAELERLRRIYPKSEATVNVMLEIADGAFASGDTTTGIAIYKQYESSLTEEQKRRLSVSLLVDANSGDPKQLLAEAENASVRGESETALRLLENVLKKAPDGSPYALSAKNQIGWIDYLRGDEKSVKEAESLWKSVVQQAKGSEPETSTAKWHLVQLNAGPRNNIPGAVALCEELIRANPKGSFRHEQGLYSKAWLLWIHKEYGPAKAGFLTLIEAYPEKAKQPSIQAYIAECEKGLAGAKK